MKPSILMMTLVLAGCGGKDQEVPDLTPGQIPCAYTEECPPYHICAASVCVPLYLPPPQEDVEVFPDQEPSLDLAQDGGAHDVPPRPDRPSQDVGLDRALTDRAPQADLGPPDIREDLAISPPDWALPDMDPLREDGPIQADVTPPDLAEPDILVYRDLAPPDMAPDISPDIPPPQYRHTITVTNPGAAEIPERYPVAVNVNHEIMISRDPPISTADGHDVLVYFEGDVLPRLLARIDDPNAPFGSNPTRLWFRTYTPLAPGAQDDTYSLYHSAESDSPVSRNLNEIFLPPQAPTTLLLLHMEDGHVVQVTDSSTRANNGFLVGFGPDGAYGEGRFSAGLRVTGDGGRIEIPYDDSLSLQSSMLTVEAYIFLQSVAGTSWIVSRRNETTGECAFALGVQDGALVFNVSSYTTCTSALEARSSAPVVTAGAWHHIAGTLNQSTMTVYLDGLFVGSRSFGSIMPFLFETSITVGAAGDGGGSAQGAIDGVRISAEAISAFPHGQITQDPTATLGPLEEVP